jgi:hypothetical protein
MNGAGEQFRALADTGRGLHPEVDQTFQFREVIASPLLARVAGSRTL